MTDIDPEVCQIMGMSSAFLELFDRMGMFDLIPDCRCGDPLSDHIPVRHGSGPWCTPCTGCQPCRQYDPKEET